MTVPLAIPASVGDAGLTVTDDLVLFWGGWPSNWEPSPFALDGIEYNCVEQAMMAAKARRFGDAATEAKIMASPYPKAQKGFGRAVRGYDDAAWTAARYDVVLRATIEKYRQNAALLARILTTGTRTFGEASPYDDVWGIGCGVGDPRARDRARWPGQNLLGQALTAARDRLRAEAASAPTKP